MRYLLTSAFILAAFAATPSLAATTALQQSKSVANEVEHSGGCRKDSPRGQCCHAGSQPYHCH